MLTESPVDEAVRVLAADPVVRRVILFGSRARGDAQEISDIDLAVDAPDADSRVWLRLTDALDERSSLVSVDLIFLHQADDELRRNIAREGRVMFERGA